MKKLKQLKDNQKFKLSQRGVEYFVVRQDKKQKTTTYTSSKSGRSFEKSNELNCLPL